MAAQFGRRLYKGAASATVAAAVVAALSASQAPGVTADSQGRQTSSGAPSASADAGTADGGSAGDQPYYTDLPPLDSPAPSATASSTTAPTGDSAAGIPATVLDAYRKAAAELQESKPGCNLPWELLAAIGKVESGQAWGGQVDADGTTTKKILGPQLSGGAYARISDTDNGAYDGDSVYDHAVGPMQFIPSTWAWAGRDGNGDGVKDPNNVYDAALAAGHYLCRGGRDLSAQADVDSAILSYNNSDAYLKTVMSWLEYYRRGTHSVPNGSGTLPGHRSDGVSAGSADPTEPEQPPAKSPATSTPPATSDPTAPPTTPPSGGATTPPATTTPPPTPTDTVDHLTDASAGTLTATAGATFAGRIGARAETAGDKSVGRVRVRFTIGAGTDATFTGGETVATVATNSAGIALAPVLRAGETTGGFTVKAVVVGRTAVDAVSYRGTVTARAADTLARTTDTALTCVAGGEFTDALTLKATYKDAVADKVAATATLITSADDATANDKGPYFRDADGNAVRTLTTLTTDADGLLKLPRLYAGDTAGTYLLRVTTTGGATATVELTVTAAPADTATDSPSPSPSTTADAG